MYDHKPDRVRAHVFVAALALLLDRALAKKLPGADCLAGAVETVRCAQIQIGARTKLCLIRGSRQAAEVLQILRLKELDPPEPVPGKKEPTW